ncbi:Formate dehydrogenase subunit alpha [uncultured archaeon]|nr:Formate dehydrogenase subunit alpha [uncultured archaeon]
MNAYSTICPGCNFGCGLYIRENGTIDLDFRKSSPANAGKLCRFGMSLPRLYKPVKSMVEGKETTPEEAAKEAARRISASKGSVAFLSLGNTTCEEVLAFQKLAVPYLCTGANFDALPKDVYLTLSVGIPYTEIEAAKHIVLFIDPYEQYPLTVRRLLSAKKKGAKITSVWWKDLPLADENIRPADISKLQLTKDSLVISDFHPLSDAEQVKSVLSLAKNAGAKVTFLKPFANSTGAYVLSKDAKQKSFAQLVEDINKGTVKTLFCLESDPSTLIPSETLSKLTNLIIQTGHASAGTAKANVVIAHEPLYRKKGTLINNEGRGQALGGAGTNGLEALGIIAGTKFEFDSLHDAVKKALGIQAVDEFLIPKYDRPAYGAIQAAAKPPEAKTTLVSVYNPFMWFGLPDDNDFVELNLNTVRALKLLKGGTLKIKSNGSTIEKKFKVAPVQDNILLTGNRFGIEKGSITPVEISR